MEPRHLQPGELPPSPKGLLCCCGLRAAKQSPLPNPALLSQSGESELALLEQLWPFKQPSPDTSSRYQPSLPWVRFPRAGLPYLPKGFPDSSVGKESTCDAGDPGWIPGLGRCPWRRDRLLKARLLAKLLKCRDQILFTSFPLSALSILP